MWNTLLLGSFKKGKQMSDMRVYSSIGYLAGLMRLRKEIVIRITNQSQSMESPISLFGAFTTRKDGRILVKLLLLDREVNSYDVLPDHTACSNVQMPGIKVVMKNRIKTQIRVVRQVDKLCESIFQRKKERST